MSICMSAVESEAIQCFISQIITEYKKDIQNQTENCKSHFSLYDGASTQTPHF